MAERRSYGLLLFRHQSSLEVLLGHMGGPFWSRRRERAWTMPKGEPLPGEEPLATAHREFEEETGLTVPHGRTLELGSVRQSGGKTVSAWALESDLDLSMAQFGTFEMEWPPRSGRLQRYPELDRLEWMSLERARGLIVSAQASLVDRLEERLAINGEAGD